MIKFQSFSSISNTSNAANKTQLPKSNLYHLKNKKPRLPMIREVKIKITYKEIPLLY